MQTTEIRSNIRPLLRVLQRYGLLEQMAECYLQTFYQGYNHLRILSRDSVGKLITIT